MKRFCSLIISVLVSFAVLGGDAEAKGKRAAAPPADLVSVKSASCGKIVFSLPALNGGGQTLEIVSLSIDGAAPAKCDFKGDTATLESAAGRTVILSVKADALRVPGSAVLEMFPVDKKDVKWEASFAAAKDEHYYGFGEKFNTIDQRGKVTRILNIDKHHNSYKTDDPAFIEDRAYKNVPFFMSSRGYGVWLDDYAPSYFDMDSKGDGKWSARITADRLRLYIIPGPKLPKVLERFTAATGRPPLWPKWAFAPWKSRNVHNGQADFDEDVFRQRKLDIPGSVIVIDSPWETCYNDFNFNKKQFPKYKQMIQTAHDNGYKVVLWIAPYTNVTNNTDMIGIQLQKCSNYDTALKRNMFVLGKDGRVSVTQWWKGVGSLFDFTNPDAAQYWKEAMKKLTELGADGIKVDDGESEFAIDGIYSDGTSGPRMQNRFCELYHRATYEAISEALKGDGAVFSRAGWAGTQKYGIPWAGDNPGDFSSHGLPGVVIAGQSIAMSGFPVWGHDIGGYLGTQKPETFVRWAQFGALSPVMQIHMTTNRGAWDFGDDALAAYIKYSKLHMSLFPYIYAMNAEAARTGMPMMRPLPLLYQDDPQAHVFRYEYLFGPDLLVAPVVTEGATSREVYFPKGDKWIDYWTGEEFVGGQLRTVDAPLDKLPLYARRGALIPMLPDDVDTLVEKEKVKAEGVAGLDDRLIARVWPGHNNSLAVTQDGLTLEAKPQRDALRLCASGGTPRRLIWKISGAAAKSVKIKGKALPKKPCESLSFGDSAWCYDGQQKQLSVSVATGSGTACAVVK